MNFIKMKFFYNSRPIFCFSPLGRILQCFILTTLEEFCFFPFSFYPGGLMLCSFLLAPSRLLGALSSHFLPGWWAPGMLRFHLHWKLTQPHLHSALPTGNSWPREIQARSPGAEKSAGPSPPQWPCCACGFSSPGAQSCPFPPPPLAWLLF